MCPPRLAITAGWTSLKMIELCHSKFFHRIAFSGGGKNVGAVGSRKLMVCTVICPLSWCRWWRALVFREQFTPLFRCNEWSVDFEYFAPTDFPTEVFRLPYLSDNFSYFHRNVSRDRAERQRPGRQNLAPSLPPLSVRTSENPVPPFARQPSRTARWVHQLL